MKGLDSWLEGFQEEERAAGALRIGQRALASAPRPGRVLAEAVWLQEQQKLLCRGWWPSHVSARHIGTLGAPQAKVGRVERSQMTAACFQSKLA